MSNASVQSPRVLESKLLGAAIKTIYVDAAQASEGNGTQANPFKTIQKAYDSIPSLVTENGSYTIQLADGIHSENYRAAADMPRPAILFCSGKWLRSRTARTNNVLTGAVIIKGNAVNKTAVVIKTTADYNFGVYNGQGQLAVEDLKIEAAPTGASTLLVSHRNDSYVHANNVELDGGDKALTSYGAYAESGGQLELTGSADIKNCSVGVGALTASDTISISDDINIYDNNTGVLAKHGACVLVTNTNGAKRGIKLFNNSAYDIDAYNGANVECRGKDGNYKTDVTKAVECAGKVRIGDGSTMSTVWTRFIGIVENYGHLYLNNCAHQAQIRNTGKVRLNTVDSFIAPSTRNDTPLCLINSFGGEVEHNATCSVGAGDYYGENIISTVTAADNVLLNVFSNAKSCFISGNGANRVGWSLPLVFTDTGLPIEQGFTLQVWGSSWGADITGNVDGSVNIGNGTGQYSGATFVFDGSTWRIVGRGIQR